MRRVYINGAACISAQKTFDGSFLEEIQETEGRNVLPVVPPVYKDYISPGMIRRMGSGVKNGVVASALALKEAGDPQLDAIITGTGVGCIKDSENFLTAILQNDEQFLTPTAFIQSTHNTVGAQIALGLGCKAYNFTYVQAAASFESAVLDARLQLLTGEAEQILVGGVDEKADVTYQLFELAGMIKKDVSEKNSPGAVYSEGASFFVLGDQHQESSYAEMKDIRIVNRLEAIEVLPQIRSFLEKNGLSLQQLDAVVLGNNQDSVFDHYYDFLPDDFEGTVLNYKHLSGEYNTASAFGFWVGANILRRQVIPEAILVQGNVKPELNHVLLYNQYQGLDHSFVLLSKC